MLRKRTMQMPPALQDLQKKQEPGRDCAQVAFHHLTVVQDEPAGPSWLVAGSGTAVAVSGPLGSHPGPDQ
jgi:hypothetical protein